MQCDKAFGNGLFKIKMDKNILREKYKDLRDSLNTDLKKIYEQKLLENFKKLDLENFHNFFIYNSFKSEADTSLIINFLINAKKNVFLPKIEENNMFFIKYSGENNLFKNKFGILEPDGEKTYEKPDICIIPLLAADLKGNRLGYGGGYYDRFLKGTDCLKAGLMFSFQITDKLFKQDFDVPLDILITEKNLIRIKQNG